MVCPTPDYPPLEPPATPIMLYIGAGYDLSPLLTFSSQEPNYPIVPLKRNATFRYPAREPYTSFIFADAKPRHTYAFMVPDFEEWKDVDSRIKNVLHYSQGLLTRWRCLPGADDLIWFEGGGDQAHVRKRISDPEWRSMPSITKFTRLFSRKCICATEPSYQPLTTVYYLFNTLDVELTRSPRMEKMWTRVEALYVHGLMIHRSTGCGLSHSPMHNSYPSSLPANATAYPSANLGSNLKRVYVLVGSWSGKAGVKHVDFIKEARARLRMREITNTPAASLNSDATSQHHRGHPTHTIEHDPSFNSIPAPISTSPYSLAPITASDLLFSSLSSDILTTETLSDNNNEVIQRSRQGRPSLDSLSSSITASSFSSEGSPSPSVLDFHISIPQIAWSDKLNHGKGGYYVSRTVEDCQKLVHGQQRRSGEDHPKLKPEIGITESAATDEKPVSHRPWNLKPFARSAIDSDRFFQKPAQPLPRPPPSARRRPPKLRLDSPPAPVATVHSAIAQQQSSAQSPISQSMSQGSFEYYYQDLSHPQTVFSPTPTIFVPPLSAASTVTASCHAQQQPWPSPSPATTKFMFARLEGELDKRSPWVRFRDKCRRAASCQP